MADISAWSPVDESNNTAPPHGWPENMQASAVNNSARALMGGVRRWYDTVTAQITAINSNFANFLPLTGGTLTGNLTAPTLISSGNVNAAVNINAGGSIAATLDVIAFRNMSCVGLSATNVIASGTVSGAAASFTNIGATATVTTAGLTASGTVQGAYLNSTGHIDAAGTVGAAALVSSGNINGVNLGVSNSISATGAIAAGGTISTPGTVQGGYLRSTGNIDATGTVGAAALVSSGNINAVNIGTSGFLSVGTTLTAAGIATLNAIQPNAEHDGYVGKAGFSYDSMSCWNYITVSDRKYKDDIADLTGCLDLVRAIPARSYRDNHDDSRHWGLVAQEVGEAAGDFPGHLIDPDTGQQRLVLNDLLALLWGAVRELSDRVEQAPSRS